MSALNISDLLFDKSNSNVISEFANNFGVNENQAKDAISTLAESLSRGLGANTQDVKGLDSLMDALEKGKHSRYIDEPSVLGKKETTKDGNDILGHIFGKKEVSREVANQVSQKSGISSAILKKMLPVVATMVMGALSKGVLGGSKGGVSRSKSGGLLAMLLDSDKDGSIWDDVLGMAARGLLR